MVEPCLIYSVGLPHKAAAFKIREFHLCSLSREKQRFGMTELHIRQNESAWEKLDAVAI
jgi:hypothetical protein